MHPDQFTLLNSPDLNIFKRSVAELEYHVEILDLLGLDDTAKIQIHVGGVYDSKSDSMSRFIERYELLPEEIRRRLVIENDERLYSLRDCVGINFYCGIPVVFDAFHHQLYNNGEGVAAALRACARTWEEEDGLPMVDYSSQQADKRQGAHAETIDVRHFKRFIEESKPFDFDLMLEIKDKEESAAKAVKAVSKDKRFVGSV
jgi:UV DNA damage endonuclease